MYQRKLRQYLSNRMVLEGEHSSIVYLLDTNYIYIYTVIYLYSIDNMQREREAVTHTYYHSQGNWFFCPQVSNESFITQSLAPMVTASTQLITTVHSAVIPKS